MDIKTAKEQIKYYETKIKKCKRDIKDLENLIKLTKKEMTEDIDHEIVNGRDCDGTPYN